MALKIVPIHSYKTLKMDEAVRQQYLKLMGVPVWQTRVPMPAVAEPEISAPQIPASEIKAAPVVAKEKIPLDVVAPAEKNIGWDGLQAAIQSCQLCELHQGRKQALTGEGNPTADVLLIGEAPDEVDDQAGQVFAGEAGQLLDAMLKAIGLDRQQVYLLNLLKCQLPEGRKPHTSELLCCDDFLQQQISLLQPKVIYAMGEAANHLLLTQQPLAAMRRRAHSYNGIPVIVSLSPKQLLQNPADKRKAWQDLLQLKKMF